jgi:ATP-dependent helicase HrpB
LKRQNASPSRLPELPVTRCLPALHKALAEGHAILTAEPGSGKTTLVPLLLRDAAWLGGRRIVMLEPRRPAARMAARRMASLLGESVGDQVGYQVRFERRIGDATRVEVLTEGLFLRRLQADPELTDVGLVIFDEFHERNLQTDLALAVCLDVCRGLREDLRLLVMSASLDPVALSSMMPARVVEAAGRSHPIEIRHSDRDSDVRDVMPAGERALAAALAECSGDVLVFLPGRAEIERLREALLQSHGSDLDVLPLYGEQPVSEQDAVLVGRQQKRRVILATDIAETSLTIEGVEAVVDCGLTRKPRFNPGNGLTRLETRRISQASALQRAGRAGRLGPGLCYRTWTEARHARLEPWTAPEIVHADLAPLALELANWGVTDPASLSWLDPPPAAHWRQAVELLKALSAVDAQGRVTATGRRMASLPTHPRLAHMLVSTRGHTARQSASDIAALLSERDPLRRDSTAGSDIEVRLRTLEAWREGRQLPADADRNALKQIQRSAEQLYRMVDAQASVDGAVDEADPAELLALAYPDRLALCTSADGRRYLMRNGRAALLDDNDPLRGSRFVVIGSLNAGQREGRIWLASTLSGAAVERLFAGVIEDRREVRWDNALQDVVARRVRNLDALLLEEKAVGLDAADDVAAVLFAQIRRDGLRKWFRDDDGFLARVRLMHQVDAPGNWPDFSEDALLSRLEQWLAPWVEPGMSARQLRGRKLDEMLAAELGWERQQRLDAWLPTHFGTPAGTQRRIDYDAEDGPVLAAPLQELLGLETGPRLADGRVIPVLHLLSPAGRPLQVTRDLAAFWRGAYTEVKKEMRGRYPKHYWPDDPAAAKATRFTKRRMS